MKTTLVLPALLALGFAVCVVAQTEADYSGWMKDIAKTKGSVTKAVKGKQNAEASTDAMHLADLFKQVGAFWSGRNVSDAADIAKSAETASDNIAAAAKAGDDAKAESELQTLTGTCGQCHMAHREGSPGNFKIK
jgi:cytochrome c556